MESRGFRGPAAPIDLVTGFGDAISASSDKDPELARRALRRAPLRRLVGEARACRGDTRCRGDPEGRLLMPLASFNSSGGGDVVIGGRVFLFRSWNGGAAVGDGRSRHGRFAAAFFFSGLFGTAWLLFPLFPGRTTRPRCRRRWVFPPPALPIGGGGAAVVSSTSGGAASFFPAYFRNAPPPLGGRWNGFAMGGQVLESSNPRLGRLRRRRSSNWLKTTR